MTSNVFGKMRLSPSTASKGRKLSPEVGPVKRFITFLAAFCLFLTYFPGLTASAASPHQVDVWPWKAHQGDTVRLSGRYFPPHVRLTVSMSCPPLFGGRTIRSRPGHGPYTDTHGVFHDFRFRTMRLKTQRSLQCFFIVDDCPPCGNPSKTPFNLLPADRPRQ